MWGCGEVVVMVMLVVVMVVSGRLAAHLVKGSGMLTITS